MRTLLGRCIALVAAAVLTSSCEDINTACRVACLDYTAVAGRVTTPAGEPVVGLELKGEAGVLHAPGCDTVQMLLLAGSVLTDPNGRYALTIANDEVDALNCSFVRVVRTPGLPWNDTLVGPLTLGEFTTGRPEDTARVDIVVQPEAAE